MALLPKAILFDLDDTILSFGSRERLLVQTAEAIAEALGPISPEIVGKT
jgi:putative hydrolase of the HAD superfamily